LEKKDMMRFLEKAYQVARKGSDLVERLLKFMTAILLLLCAAAVFFQVINRYILVKQTLFAWRSVSWTDELSRLLMVTLAYLSMGLCYKHGQLSRADMVYTRLKGLAKKALYYLETGMIIIFLIAAIVNIVRVRK
jgi:TRAP-type C4-dicarboxylate transport system permease small subunit